MQLPFFTDGWCYISKNINSAISSDFSEDSEVSTNSELHSIFRLSQWTVKKMIKKD